MLLNGPLITARVPRVLSQTFSCRQLSKSSMKPRQEKKHYRLWSLPGEFVRLKETLVKQHTMKWHPGLNAGIDRWRTIYALCDGVMVITEEQYEPDWDYPLVNEVYVNKDQERLAPPYKRYVHVIPRRRISEFKLIDTV